MAITITYKDVAVGAKENTTYTGNGKSDFTDLSNLASDNIGANYGTFESDLWLLDSSFEIMPDNNSDVDVVFWNNAVSQENKTLSTPVVLTATLTDKYDMAGITIQFDTYNNNYATDINIKWYNDTTLINEYSATNTDPKLVIKADMPMINKVVFTFNAMNEIGRFLKINNIDFGVVYEYQQKDLKSTNFIQEISPLSNQLSVNTFEFTAVAKDEYASFEKGQQIFAYYNNKLISKFYINESNKIGMFWDVSTTDIIGLLEKNQTMGGNFVNATFESVLQNILGDYYNICQIDDTLKSKLVTGYIPICTMREALQQLCFGLGVCINTANSQNIKIYELSNEIIEEFNGSNIFTNNSIETQPVITNLLVSYKYVGLYDLTPEIIFNETITKQTKVIFNDLYSGFQTTNCTVVESNMNYCIIQPTDITKPSILKGEKYIQVNNTIEKINTDIPANTEVNIVEVKDGNFINVNNVDEISTKIFNYYKNNKYFKGTINLTKSKIGDIIKLSIGEKAYKGRIEEMSFSGTNKMIADVVVHILDEV